MPHGIFFRVTRCFFELLPPDKDIYDSPGAVRRTSEGGMLVIAIETDTRLEKSHPSNGIPALILVAREPTARHPSSWTICVAEVEVLWRK